MFRPLKAIQRSLIFVLIASAYATFYYSVIIVTLVLNCFGDIAFFVLLTPPLFHPILGVFPLDQIPDVGSFIFEVFQPM